MGFMKKIFSNTHKPEGILGKMMVASMNSGHAKMAQWGRSHLPQLQPKDIADLGCGGGKNVEEFLKLYPAAHVTGLDYSEVSVEASRKRNAKAIAKGRCTIVQGDVSALPMKDGSFDLVSAFETVYFWPGPVQSFAQVYRVLRPGGVFLIVNESDATDKKDEKWLKLVEGMHLYTEEQLTGFLREAGFADITVGHQRDNRWICFAARK